ncbi:MAG: hypothetical protein WAW06_08660 [bacterium]
MFLRLARIPTVLWVVTLIAASGLWGADIPAKVNYQGMLADASGEPLPGEHTVVFRIFDAAGGGTELWSETQPVVAGASGVFSVILGDVASIDAGFDGPRWLEVVVDGEILAPRRELVSVPYAFQAANAHMVAGLHADAFADSAHSHSLLDALDGEPAGAVFVDDEGSVGVGTETPGAKLDVAGTARMTGFNMPTGAAAGQVLTSDAAGAGTWQSPQALPDADWVVSGGNMYSAVPGNVGIGRTNPAYKLHVWEDSGADRSVAVYGANVATSGRNNCGVYGATSTLDPVYTGAGVQGVATGAAGSSSGVLGLAEGSEGTGVSAVALHTSGSNKALCAETKSPNGYAGYFAGGRNYFQGKVGIGIDEPDNLLHVSGAGDVSGGVAGYGEVVGHFRTSVGHTAIAVDAAGGDLDAIVYLGKQGNAVWDLRNDSDAGNKFQLRYQGGAAQNKPYLTVSNSGDVGIGTTDFLRKLAVVDSAAREGTILALNRMSADGVGAQFVGNNAALWTDMNGCGLAASGNKWGILAVSSKTTLEAGAVHGVLVDGGSVTAQARLCYRSPAGTLYKVHGDGASSTVMATSAGKRTLVCPESPEAWFEDYGTGEIKSGSCHVDLDPIFLDCITVSETHPLKVFVQLTSELEQQYYVKKGQTGFDVVVVGDGANSAGATFDYKVVGKWRGYENLRFERAPEETEVIKVSATELPE